MTTILRYKYVTTRKPHIKDRLQAERKNTK